MPILNEFTFKSSNCKDDIYVREWLPDDAPRGVVLICHGVAEHMERYDAFAKHLAANGYVVAGNDHLGHGKSISDNAHAGFFGENGGWELVVGDVRKLYERLRERYPNLPLIIFAHSMGSFIARTYVIRYHDGPDGLILSGTGQQTKALLAAGLAIARREVRRKGAHHSSEFVNKLAFGAYNKRIKDAKTDRDWLSDNEESVNEYLGDPLCGFTPTAGLFRDMFSAIKYVSSAKNLARVNKDLPVFLISGSADPVGDYGKGVIRAYNGYIDAGLSDVTLKLYNGGRHEIIADKCRDEVFADVLDWVGRRHK